jgi:hypothetical protein
MSEAVMAVIVDDELPAPSLRSAPAPPGPSLGIVA